jgi:hypothetical protein
MKNIFKNLWENLENSNNLPTRARKIINLDYSIFANKIDLNDQNFANDITNSLMLGDIYILKGAFNKEFFDSLKNKCFDYFKNEPSSFHKMLEGCPDFHRTIDLDVGKKYSFKLCKHSFYFYNWNKDPLNLFDTTYERWRKIKKLMGYDPNMFENNTPKDGAIDRIQVVQYPSKYGFLEPHSDPYKYQKFFISGYMSKKGKDYFDGGFYALGKENKVIDVEKYIDVGDVGIGFATIVHGVAPVNRNKDPKWKDVNDGRWFYSLYTNESDEIKNRHTGHGATEQIKINDKNLFPPE